MCPLCTTSNGLRFYAVILFIVSIEYIHYNRNIDYTLNILIKLVNAIYYFNLQVQSRKLINPVLKKKFIN